MRSNNRSRLLVLAGLTVAVALATTRQAMAQAPASKKFSGKKPGEEWDGNLGGTEVSNAGLAHLEGLTNLQTLILSDTSVTGAGLKHLEGLAELVNVADHEDSF